MGNKILKWIVVAIVVFGAVKISGYVGGYFAKQELKDRETSLNASLDEEIAKANTNLPQDILKGRIALTSVAREGKIIYQNYTLTIGGEEASALKDNTKKAQIVESLEADILPSFCNISGKKEVFASGYFYRFKYFTPDGELLLIVTADKDSCSKYQKT
ncbi:hypothetical protein [Yersinia enterocolitica]|uniref:hypothetical protein n=1 Tax=Yersinia enterocolitica TaxID=630 RepID=UPI0021E895D6|nr:hypothetical protein [Yersinia enterocolitica]UYK09410.1 hypothetical protein N4226_15250 [Yersinia enterocolitica]HDL7969701.1 hypothetical protein [Yersinia enterocolitica]